MSHTDLIVILDRSGSMALIQSDVEGGFDRMIEEQRAEPGSMTVHLVEFDSESIDTVYSGVPVTDVPPLKLSPRGVTPLLDAVGRTLVDLDKQYAELEDDQQPDKVLITIITDGQENASQEFSLADIKTMIKQHTNERDWAFAYLGANVDAFAEAVKMGIPLMAATNYAPTSTGVRDAMISYSSSLSSYRHSDGSTFRNQDNQTT